MEKVKSLNVVNDAAERAVKMSADYLATAKKEPRFQNNLQVTGKNRKSLPNLRAKKGVLSEWFKSN